MIEKHVGEFLKLISLMESGHHDYKLEWEKVKVSANHEEYGERLFITTVRYAGKHL